MNIRIILGFATAALITFSNHASVAAEDTGLRAIGGFGCHKSDGTCFLDIDGPAVGGSYGCPSNNVRWDAKNDINGKSWLALVMLAKAQNKKVSFYIASCYANQPAFPTFQYGSIEQ